MGNTGDIPFFDLISEDISANIRKERKKAGITQGELGKRIGVSAAMISQYESNSPYSRKPKWATLDKIAAALGISIARLIDISPRKSFWSERFRAGLAEEIENVDPADADAACIDLEYLQDIACGSVGFTFEDACNICDELGVSPDMLLKWDEGDTNGET